MSPVRSKTFIKSAGSLAKRTSNGMRILGKNLPKRGSTQDGLASIVIVTVLVVLITLITIGFARIMTRTSNNALNDQLSTAATYAVQSGVNDVIGYLKNNPAASATKCNDLIGSDAAPGPLFDLSNLSGDEGRTTEYTCVLINQTPTDLAYQQLPPSKSQVTKLTTSGPADKLMVSWQSTDRSKNQLPAPSSNPSLLDVSQWNDSDHSYAPVLRLSLYPIPSDGQVSGVQAVSKTFFLYPTAVGGNVTVVPYSTADGTLQNVNCGSKNAVGFTGTADYDCNIIISNLGTAASPAALGYFYARLTPIYGQADVKLKAQTVAAEPLKFTNTQAIVDVTARSSATAKRLQVRVDTNTSGGASVNIGPTEETIPEYALRTAVSVCKRLIVGSPSAIDSAFCNLSIGPPPPPAANTGNASNITTNSATLNGAVNPQGYNVTACRFEYGLTQSYGSSANCSALPGAGRGDVAVSANIGSLAGATGYHFRLVATNINGQGLGNNATFTTLTPPPAFSFGADDRSIAWGGSTTLRWSTSYVTWCWGKGGTWGGGDWKNPSGGSDATGALTSLQTYELQCGRSGIAAPTQTITINVAAQQPPAVADFAYLGQSGSSLSFRYACSNSSSASITVNPNRTGGGEGTQPLGSTGGTASVGGPYSAGDSGSARLDCSRGGQTSSQTLNWSIEGAPVTVEVSPPNDLFGVNDYDFAFNNKQPQAPNDCRTDARHTFVACFDITAYQGPDTFANRKKITKCEIRVNGTLVASPANARGTPHWSSQGRWIFYTLGWYGSAQDTDWSTGDDFGGKYNETITVICEGQGGKRSDPNQGTRQVHWSTCYDRRERGTYNTDVALNGCKPVDPPYIPPVTPSPGDTGGTGGSGGGGGVCPSGWSGTWPSCAPPTPPGGVGGCGLLDRRSIFPNYGLMSLPIFKFARMIPC